MSMPLTIKVKVQKVGNSYMITIPEDVRDSLKWEKGQTVEIGLDGDIMTVKKKEAS